ncbi:MAG: response regulator [Alphaproteobacteria bacterium]|nr:response regulator [Alphaproteobacteria bacterium]
MEILYPRDHKELLLYLPYVKLSIKDWLFADVRLDVPPNDTVNIQSVAEQIHAAFKSQEGKLYLCNENELLMIVRWKENKPPSTLADDISHTLPKEGCQIFVHKPTMAGIAKLEILITHKAPLTNPSLADLRATRRQNVVLVADDDMYMRTLVKHGIGSKTTVIETGDGETVLDDYKKNNPDVLFLDIHLPHVDGTSLLGKLFEMDPKAYIVMLSADSSRKNVELTANKGAKGFLTKPFTKEKLQEYLSKCPTFY